MKGYDISDTICAVSTPPGIGAIGVIRLSGDKSVEITEKIFRGKVLSLQAPNTLHFGKINDGEKDLDEVVVSLFRAPHSYTGEDVTEISCHGSSFIIGEIMKLLVSKGARLAREGEFTLRAFFNGKLDLSQAEAVADLIASDSRASRDLALNQLRGGYSAKLRELRDELINFASMLELELDFSEEDVAFADRGQLVNLIERIRQAIGNLSASFEEGNVMKNGLPVAIIGEPNVGKSTLLNGILREEKAIVSEIPGTTRDSIEDEISVGGVIFRFMDTAGLRQTKDVIENMGIERARKKAEMAKIVLYLHDAGEVYSSPDWRESWEKMEGKLNISVINKIDKLSEAQLEELKIRTGEENVCFISAKQNIGIDHLLNNLLEFVKSDHQAGDVIVSNVRHLEALMKSDASLTRALEGIRNGLSSELVAMDVRQALHYLGEITGEVSTDDLLGNIFSRFCIGK